MNNFIDEPFGLSPNLFLEPDQIAPSPANAPLVQANDFPPLPSQDVGLPPRMFELQHPMLLETNQQQAAVALSFEAKGSGIQLSTFNPNFGVQQGNIVSASGGSFLPFGGLVGGMSQWHQVNGVPEAAIVATDFQGFQAAIRYDAVVGAIQCYQYAIANSFPQLPSCDPSFVSLHNTMLLQVALNATQVQPMYRQQIPSSSLTPQHPDAMPPLPDFDATQELAVAYLRSTGALAKESQPQDAAMEDESSVPDLNDAVDSLPEQMQGLTTNSPLVEEVASPEHDAGDNHTIHDPPFPAPHPDAAVHQPAPPPNPELSGNVGEMHNLATHIHVTSASPEPVQRIMTGPPAMNEPVNPPAYNVPSDGFVYIPAEPEEQLEDLWPAATQLPAPFGPEGVLFMAESSAEPSPEDLRAGEQVGLPYAPGNALLVAEMPATEPDAPKESIEFVYCVHPSERGSTASSSSNATSPSRNWTRRSSNRVSNPAHAGSSTKTNKRKAGLRARLARATHRQGNRRSPISPSVETPVQESAELFPLFAPLPANDAIPGHSTAPGKVGPSVHYALRDEMSLYDVFVAMRAESDRNRAAGVRNANGDETFTWDESDMRLFDSLYRSSRR